MSSEDRTTRLLTCLRQALLLFVDGIEEFLGISPKTSELRKMYKCGKLGKIVE